MIGFVFRTGKTYYPQVFLEKCKYIKEKKMSEQSEYITVSIESSSNSDREDSDEENSNEENEV